MGDWFEEQNQKAPLVEIVSMTLLTHGQSRPISWQTSAGPLVDAQTLEPVTVLPESGSKPAMDLIVRYRSEPEVVRSLRSWRLRTGGYLSPCSAFRRIRFCAWFT